MAEYLQVEDNPGLVREKHTKAVINIDYTAYEQYMEKKQHLSKKDEEISDLQNQVSDLRDMVLKLVEGGALNQKGK
jgi:hypothetical protein